MCGIAGIIDFEGKAERRLETGMMLKSIRHRGPDECGIYHSRTATLGNVRLSIVDIAGGQQPMPDSTSRYWITFNGEIFNYKELRKDLENKGHVFRTHCDTEVLVELYSKYGHNCLKMLNGQYVFAIWDRVEEVLFIARDRMGIRPFFYNLHDGVFTFASEIKAIFRRKAIPRELNNQGLAQVFTFWTTITPETPFKGIYELSPGHYGYFSSKGLSTHRYWDFSFSSYAGPVSLSDATERFSDLFTDAVRLRLRADVEVGAYLSGGIDSSATVAYIRDIEPGVLNTYSIGFSDIDFDESKYQNEAVSYFKTRHHSYQCTSEEIADAFPQVVWHAETPLTRTAPAPMFLLSKMVRNNSIKVVVTGEGSDELLAGYDIFKEAIIRRFWSSQPDSAIRPLLLKRLYQFIPGIANADVRTLKMFFRYRLEDTDNPLYSHILRWNNSNHIKKHFAEALREDLKSYSPIRQLCGILPAEFNGWDPLSKAQWLEATIFMSGYLLSSQGDRMSMANSVEGRYPFLDYRIIEFCNSLQSNLKINGLNEKYLLKKMLSGKIPETIIRRTKQPYRAPVSNAFLSAKAPDWVNYLTSEDQLRKTGLFNPSSVSSAIAKMRRNGKTSEIDDMLLTAVISTQLLQSLFIEDMNEMFMKGNLSNLLVIEDAVEAFTE